jgi:hypothetical protein
MPGRMNAAKADDGVVQLKGLSGVKDGWAETSNMIGEMKDYMKLGFVIAVCSRVGPGA